jgi:uncharacterized protein YutE (UPF0331/DUF86 family)
VDRQVVAAKLESLRRCLERVGATCPDTASELAADADAQDIVAINLTRAVQLAVDIGAHVLSAKGTRPPSTMGETFELLAEANVLREDLAVRLHKSVGFRNIAIHSYEKIDWEIVHGICRNRLVDFEDFARTIAGHSL